MSFIYLSSPYTKGNTASKAERIAYFQVANKAASVLMASGLSVYSPVTHGHVVDPHITDLGYTATHAWWMEKCMPFLRQAQAVYVLMVNGWDVSDGVKQEIDTAKMLKKPLIYIDPITIGLYSDVEVDLPSDTEPAIAAAASEQAQRQAAESRQRLVRGH